MHDKCRLCWRGEFLWWVVGGWWVGGKPNLVISDELINYPHSFEVRPRSDYGDTQTHTHVTKLHVEVGAPPKK